MLCECDDCNTAINQLVAAETTVSLYAGSGSWRTMRYLEDSVRIDCVLVSASHITVELTLSANAMPP